jgi:cytochrome c oxidase subunit II
MTNPLPLWPDAASAHATSVDEMVIGFTVLIVALSAPVFILIAVFAVKYRRGRKVDRRLAADRNVWLEVSWAGIPFILILVFFAWSAWSYFDLRDPPADATEIAVVAKQWMWKVQHPEGRREIDELHVPTGEAVKLLMSSQDVIHSFYLPALRLKQDVLPGRYTELWFVADKPGTYALACAEFCGTDHSTMGGRLVVMAPDDYARWLGGGESADATLAARGAALFVSLGCSGCHRGGSVVRAPPLEGVYGHPVELADGRSVVADEQYLRDSILLPNRDVVASYEPRMPSFANRLGEDELVSLVAYLRSLGGGKGARR